MSCSKSQSKSESQGQKSQLRWNLSMDTILINMLFEEVRKGKRKGPYWDNSVWSPVTTAISNSSGQYVTKKHIESRLRTMKTDFRNFVELKSKSGFGWDQIKQTITATDDKWDELFQCKNEEKKFKQFRDRGLRWDFNKLSAIINNHQATGEYTYGGVEYESVDRNDDVDDGPDMQTDSEEVHLDNVEDGASASKVSGGKRPSSSTQRRLHSKKVRRVDDVKEIITGLMSKLDQLVQTFDPTATGKKLYGLVMSTEGFNEKYLRKAFKIIRKDPIEMEVFLMESQEYRKMKLAELHSEI